MKTFALLALLVTFSPLASAEEKASDPVGHGKATTAAYPSIKSGFIASDGEAARLLWGMLSDVPEVPTGDKSNTFYRTGLHIQCIRFEDATDKSILNYQCWTYISSTGEANTVHPAFRDQGDNSVKK
ncbi:MAG: hypothetical protein EOP11_06535 [Proteobacteria bacterium]|nr:MAG: hypothetical protein EOP11_06535 [Pseudomonadota bacterium]